MMKRFLFVFFALLAFAAGAGAQDMTSTPLTLEAVEAGTISITNTNGLSLEYTSSISGTQTSTANPVSIEVAAGETVSLTCSNTEKGLNFCITSTNDVYVYGNALSLVFGSGFVGQTDLSACEYGILAALFCPTPGSEAMNPTILNHPTKDIVLPATTLSSCCYMYMFSGCSNLTRGPELPATTLSVDCYHRMFEYSGLVMAPTLPATALSEQCYGGMFDHCANLRYVKCLATDIVDTTHGEDATTDCWLANVAATGTFVKADAADWSVKTKTDEALNGIPEGWTVLNASDFDPYATPLTFEAVEAGTITAQVGDLADVSGIAIQYKKNNEDWTGVEWKTPIWLDAEDVISFRGDNTACANEYGSGFSFVCSNGCYVYGNVMSLLRKTGFATLSTATAPYAFSGLFTDNWSENTTILNHPTKDIVLPATSIGEYCYNGMFVGCAGLTRAPVLPATTMMEYCYNDMFSDCTGLTAAPALPATTLAEGCYTFMFMGCTGLTTAPALPATTLANYCYDGIFMGCTNLQTAPELPATTLAEGCYSEMFMNCTSLTTAPDLPATTLAEGCYNMMFSGCTSLNYVKCLAISNLYADYCTNGWMNDVAATGTFVKASAADWSAKVPTDDGFGGTNINGIPAGWTAGEELVLIENDWNNSYISEANGQTTDVTLSGRTLRGGRWNTLCLPFALTAEQIAAGPLAGAIIRELDSYENDGTNVTVKFKNVTAMAAETPYIVYPDADIVNPTFEDVTIFYESANPYVLKGYAGFYGTHNPKTLTDGDRHYLFLSNNTFYYPSGADVTVGPFRAYFMLDYAVPALGKVIIDWGEGEQDEATAIAGVDSGRTAADGWHTLSGIRLQGRPTEKGLYIVNGKKVAIQ